MSVQDAYDAWAGSYDGDRNLTRDLDHAVVRELLGAARPNAVLEVGCGTGKNTAVLAAHAGSVLALDFSAGMLEQARAKVGAGHVRFVEADVTEPWPCPDAGFDLITCNLVLEHVADLGFVFAEAARALAPGGRLLVCELHPFRQYRGSQARFERGGDTVRIAMHVHHVSDFVEAARAREFTLATLREWWHEEDDGDLPRLISFEFDGRA